jgi:hypothetical protein
MHREDQGKCSGKSEPQFPLKDLYGQNITFLFETYLQSLRKKCHSDENDVSMMYSGGSFTLSATVFMHIWITETLYPFLFGHIANNFGPHLKHGKTAWLKPSAAAESESILCSRSTTALNISFDFPSTLQRCLISEIVIPTLLLMN